MTRSALSSPLLLLTLGVAACVPQGDPGLGTEFTEDFDGDRISTAWNNTGGNYALRDGELFIRGARNKPLWLKRTLPHDVEVEFDMRSESDAGDIKVELFGDGVSKAEQDSYTATSYVVIFGGWNNSVSVLARMNEHGDDRIENRDFRVEKGRRYHVKIRRSGGLLTVKVDDQVILRMDDPEPLSGRGHDHFAFNNWETELYFDNLVIRAL